MALPHMAAHGSSASGAARLKQGGGGNPLAPESHARRATVPPLHSWEMWRLGSEGVRGCFEGDGRGMDA